MDIVWHHSPSLAAWLFLGNRTVWMFGSTPPWDIVTPASSLFSSSSFLIIKLDISFCKMFIPDSELEVPGDNAWLLVVPGSIPRQLQDLGCQVFHHLQTKVYPEEASRTYRSQINRCPSSNPLRIVALPEQCLPCILVKSFERSCVLISPEQPMDSSNGKLKPCPARPGFSLSALHLSSFATARHFYKIRWVYNGSAIW